ncbi:hypothetical protein RZS08_64230, partial [Arthrospira platensis SPKY1]|nr:hypothetical protein [Arthrospira platensis SPKY1]
GVRPCRCSGARRRAGPCGLRAESCVGAGRAAGPGGEADLRVPPGGESGRAIIASAENSCIPGGLCRDAASGRVPAGAGLSL